VGSRSTPAPTGLAGFPGEKITEGLDGLFDRLVEYRELGARFTKWRAVITIGQHIPSFGCIAANAEALGRFAASSQEAGLVPIVEPEVLMDGDHPIERCDVATRDTLAEVFAALRRHRVQLDGILLKPNMVLSGSDCPTQATVTQVAQATVAALLDCVPASVPGIVFLSGGQSDEVATAHLNAMNRLGGVPWELSFSYGRALQAPALKAWKGEAANGPAAPAGLPPPGPPQRRRPLGQLHRGHGDRRRLTTRGCPPARRRTVADALARRVPAPQDPSAHWLVEALRELGAVDRAVYEAVARTPTATLDGPVRQLSGAADQLPAVARHRRRGRPGRGRARPPGGPGGSGGHRRHLGRGQPGGQADRPPPPPGPGPAGPVRGPPRAHAPVGVVPLRACRLGVRLRLRRRPPPAALAVPIRLLAAAVAYSRVHTGVHYPGDVVIGSVTGAGTAAMVAAVADRAAGAQGASS
jgi:hypothetical protein